MSTSLPDVRPYCLALAKQARAASRVLALASGELKDRWLREAAKAIAAGEAELLAANVRDLAAAQEQGLTLAQIDRLRLNPKRLQDLVGGLHSVAALPDPIGKVLDCQRRPNGLEIRKIAVPLGVLFFIYESRPNVTVDAAALAVKSGNAIILRGGKEAAHSNQALARLLRGALDQVGLPTAAVQLVDRPDRALVGELLQMPEFIDLAIPRGGEGLIRTVAEQARMPVLKHYKGNCHVYVDRAANLDVALRVLINAKCQRPGVCNAAESLLVHEEVAARFLPMAGAALRAQGVELRGCAVTREHLPDAKLATEEDYAAEYLDLILSVKVVQDLDVAIEHVNRYGSQHTEAIVTTDVAASQRFVAAVDAAAVVVNASTRFHDGYEFGLGAEIGISTDKFHARGPCGLLELTSYKYVVLGDGHVRE